MKNSNPPGYSRENKNPIKIVTSDDWNELNRNLTEQQYGAVQTRYDETAHVIPSDSLHTPFFGQIADEKFTDIIIGRDRQEDYYPFIDVASVQRNVHTFTLRNRAFLPGAPLVVIESEKYTELISYIRPDPDTVLNVPANDNGTVVGYKYILHPEVTGVDDSDPIYTYVTVTYELQTLSGQNDFFTISNDQDSWGALIEDSVDPNVFSLETLLSNAVSATVDTDKTLPSISGFIPVGVAFHHEDLLDYWVQLPVNSIAAGDVDFGGGAANVTVSASVIFNVSGAIQLSGDVVFPGPYEFYSTYVGETGEPTTAPKGWHYLSAMVPVQNSIEYDGTYEAPAIQLVNDEETPDVSKYYGTNAAGDLGYHSLSATVVTSVSASGALPTLITGGGPGHEYLGDIYPNGADVPSGVVEDVNVYIMQILSGETVPSGTWLLTTQIGTTFYGQVAVWL